MGHLDQYAKLLWATELDSLLGAALSWTVGPELSLVSVLLDGVLEVLDSAGLVSLPAPWSLLVSLRFVVVDFKMQGDHTDAKEWNLALQRRQAWVVELHKDERHADAEAVVLWVVHARLPGWLEPSAMRVAPGCYEVSTTHGAGLWIAANELPLHPALIPFLVASDGEPMVRFARWAVDHRPVGWVLELLEELPMTEAQKQEIRRQLSDSLDPERLRARAGTVTFLLEQMSKHNPAMVAELLRPLPAEQRLDGLNPEQRLEGLNPEQRLAGLEPEQRLAGLEPEQRLAGLDAAHTVLALPLELLRAVSAEYLATLPQDIQDEVRRRLAG